MRKSIILFIVLSFVFAGAVINAEKKFGEEIKIEKLTKISDMLDKPEDFLNKKIRIEGNILDVCAHKGCWMSLSSDKEFQSIRIKVKDGDMVFPLIAKGKNAIVEGSLYKIEITKEQCIAIEKHKCKENKKKFDPSKIKTGKTIYQFKPLGVVIK